MIKSFKRQKSKADRRILLSIKKVFDYLADAREQRNPANLTRLHTDRCINAGFAQNRP